MDELTRLHPHGVFLRREALAHGYDDQSLRAGLRDRALVRIRHGAYVAAEAWTAASAEGRHGMRAHAVGLSHMVDVAASHTSAAALHGMSLWGCDLDRIHVARVRAVGGRRHHDVAYHDSLVGELTTVDGTATVGPAAAALGAASIISVESGLVVVDSAYRSRSVTRASLLETAEMMRGWPGTARLQITLRLASEGAESVGESRARFLMWSYGLPKPELQYHVYVGRELVGITDFAWPDHGLLGEFDGKVKYDVYLRPGETPADAVFREKRREDRLREATGWPMIRLSWADLSHPTLTAERLRTALRNAGKLPHVS